MKKLVLIPHERYHQLLTKETSTPLDQDNNYKEERDSGTRATQSTSPQGELENLSTKTEGEKQQQQLSQTFGLFVFKSHQYIIHLCTLHIQFHIGIKTLFSQNTRPLSRAPIPGSYPGPLSRAPIPGSYHL